MIFFSGSKSLTWLRPKDSTAIFIMSLSGIPRDLFCFFKKYFPASNIEFKGIRPTNSDPVTLAPLFWAFFDTSSKTVWIGVSVIFVRFIEICVIPNSSIYQPIALTCFKEPGMVSGLPFLSYTMSPITGWPFLFILPFSLTSNAIAFANLVDFVFKLILYAIKKSLTPIAVAPDFLLKLFPKSGFHSFLDIFSFNPSYSPDLTLAKFFLFSSLAAYS